jgi:hypothetical protein
MVPITLTNTLPTKRNNKNATIGEKSSGIPFPPNGDFSNSIRIGPKIGSVIPCKTLNKTLSPDTRIQDIITRAKIAICKKIVKYINA